MKKDCSTCKFHFGETCAGHSEVYQYGEKITGDTKRCDGWSESFE